MAAHACHLWARTSTYVVSSQYPSTATGLALLMNPPACIENWRGGRGGGEQQASRESSRADRNCTGGVLPL